MKYLHDVLMKASYQSKIDLRDDRLLLFGAGITPYIFPFAELPCLESNDFGDRLRELHGHYSQQAVRANYSCADFYQLLFPIYRKSDVTVPPEIVRANSNDIYTEDQLEVIRKKAYSRVARFDLQLAGPRTVRLFHACDGTLFVSTEPDYCFSNKWFFEENGKPLKNPPPVPDRELRTGTLLADFTDYFAVSRSGDRDYLVTQHGKVYMAVPKGKAEVEVTAIWSDPGRVIAGVVQDAKTGSVYGYGAVGVGDPAGRFYVKFDPRPVEKAYRLTVPPWNSRMDAYLESYECARAFRLTDEKKK